MPALLQAISMRPNTLTHRSIMALTDSALVTVASYSSIVGLLPSLSIRAAVLSSLVRDRSIRKSFWQPLRANSRAQVCPMPGTWWSAGWRHLDRSLRAMSQYLKLLR